MATKKEEVKASPETTPEAKEQPKLNVHPSKLKASENGTDIMDYAKRVLEAQSPDLALTFQFASVEKALLGQGYEFNDIRDCLLALQEELTEG